MNETRSIRSIQKVVKLLRAFSFTPLGIIISRHSFSSFVGQSLNFVRPFFDNVSSLLVLILLILVINLVILAKPSQVLVHQAKKRRAIYFFARFKSNTQMAAQRASVRFQLISASDPPTTISIFSKAKQTRENEILFLSDIFTLLGAPIPCVDILSMKGLSCIFDCLLSQAKHALGKLQDSFTLPSLQKAVKKISLRILDGPIFTAMRSGDVERLLQNVEKAQRLLFVPDAPVLTYEKSASRPFTPELEEAFKGLGQLEAGWTGEENSVPPSTKNLNLLREIFSELPPEFDFPQLYASYDGSLEFEWRDCRLYGFLDDELLEFFWMGALFEPIQFENTGVASELHNHLRECLQAALDRENPPDDD